MDLVLLVLTGAVASLSGVVLVQRRTNGRLRRAQEKVVTEEARVFDFLHGLGEALSETTKTSDLHALIVKGVQRIMGASSGGLYLAAEGSGGLQPAYLLKGCPPLVDFPLGVPESFVNDPEALLRHVRLRTVRRGEGALAQVWESAQAQVLTGQDLRLDTARRAGFEYGSVALVPLLYAKRNLGVLMMARAPGGEAFGASDLQVMQTLAEQSAFALCTAEVFSDAAEKRRLDHDLQVAYEIQRILLPSEAPEVTGFEISGVNLPAKHVSGDYFDYFGVDGGHCGVAIADVSGKGVPASLIMATCRSVLRSKAPGELSAAEVLRRVNEQMFPDIREDMFISMAYAVVAHDSARVVLARAGHDAPLHYRASDQSVLAVNPPGMAVGIDAGSVFNRVIRDHTVEMESGDCLIFYTDGVTEALDAQGEEFGMERMRESILGSAVEGAAAVVDRLTGDLRRFAGKTPQHDDITLIVIRRK